MKSSGIALGLAVVFAAPALGAPGDVRLIQGKVEWPATVTGREPFIVVRTDDGRVYYTDATTAQRYVRGPLGAGSQVALLGLEGGKPHEIVAVALGTGDAAALSLAVAQASPSPSPTTPPPPPGPSGVAPTAVAASPRASPAPSRLPAQAAPTPAVPSPAPQVNPAPPTTAPAARWTAPAEVGAASPAASPVTSPPARLASVRPAPQKDARSLTIRGTVKGIGNENLFLTKEDGWLVAVDIGRLDPITVQRLTPGSSVAVVVVPLRDRYEATGVIETDAPRPAR